MFKSILGDLDAKAGPDNEEALSALLAMGVEQIVPPSDEVPEWRELIHAANEELISEGLLDPDLWAELQRLLAEYRSGKVAVGVP